MCTFAHPARYAYVEQFYFLFAFHLQVYRLCTTNYLASGKDGYSVFSSCPVIVRSIRTISYPIRI